MTRGLGFVAGVVVGHWLALGAVPSLGDVPARAARALGPQEELAATSVLADAVSATAPAGRAEPRLVALDRETQGREGEAVAVPLESALGVWVVEASLDDGAPARFLVDTGSSVVIVAPRVAATVGITAPPQAPRIELQTVAGRSSGPTARVRSLRVGGLELTNVPVVLHDPGPGFDGILGNAFLRRYRLTLDPVRHLLVLRPLRPALAPHAGHADLGDAPTSSSHPGQAPGSGKPVVLDSSSAAPERLQSPGR